MIITDDYTAFLRASAAALASTGAEPLIPPNRMGGGPGWAAGWSQILLVDGPGPSSVYAFTDGDPAGLPAIRARLDHLVAGLAQLVRAGAPPLRVVAIVAFTGPVDHAVLRRAAKLAPSVFYSGLRPFVWAVDLHQRRLATGSLIRTREGRDLVEAALRGEEIVTPARHPQSDAALAVSLSRRAWVTYALIALNAGIFLWVYLTGDINSLRYPVDYGALVPSLTLSGQWWRLLTAIFLHAGVAHIVSNMVSLYVVGTLAERLYGHLRYLTLYIGSGLIGSVTSLGYSELVIHSNTPGVGASGAIFGITGALIALRFLRSSPIPPRLRRYVSTSVLTVVVINLVILYFIPYVDNAAHVGGLISGGVLALFIAPTERRPIPSPA